MDFKITSENIESSIESYKNIAKKIEENKERVEKAINDLTDESWNGLGAKSGKTQFILWTNKCDNLKKHIDEFKDILKEKETEMDSLFTQGKNLKI